MEIPSVLEDNNYCRVSAREIECESQLGVQEFSGFQQLSVISQSVSNDKSKLGYLWERSICLLCLPSTSNLYGLETRTHSQATVAFQQNWKNLGFLYAFPPFSLIGRVLLRVREERLTMSLVTTSRPVQPWYSPVLDLCVTDPLLLPQSQDYFTRSKGTTTSSSVERNF